MHPALPLMIWLMAAHSKGYIITPLQASRCLAMVHHFADSPVKDHLSQVIPGNMRITAILGG